MWQMGNMAANIGNPNFEHMWQTGGDITHQLQIMWQLCAIFLDREYVADVAIMLQMMDIRITEESLNM